MASTKEMMARAKARKAAAKQPQYRINELKAEELLIKLAHLIIEASPECGYNADAFMKYAAQEMVDDKGLNAAHLQQLLEMRVRLEKSLKQNYGVEIPTGFSAFTCDIDALLNNAGVSQLTRVTHGLLDSVIGILAVRVGAVEIHNVG